MMRAAEATAGTAKVSVAGWLVEENTSLCPRSSQLATYRAGCNQCQINVLVQNVGFS
jgi:hypothetical protein